MKRIETITSKSLALVDKIIDLHQYLVEEKQEKIVSRQIIHSAAVLEDRSLRKYVGLDRSELLANLQALLRHAKAIAKWVRLLIVAKYLDPKKGDPLIKDSLEIKGKLLEVLTFLLIDGGTLQNA